MITKQELGINPFVQSLNVRIATLPIEGKYETTPEGYVIPLTVKLDAHKYTKIFHSADIRKSLWTLTPTAMKLYLYILYKVESATDYIKLNRVKVMAECEIKSRNTFQPAVKELVRLGLIQPTVEKEYYWINPQLYYCGDRVRNFPNNLNENKHD